MTCRNCGTEIAEKALICYKCGTATTEAKYAPAAPGRAGMSARVIGPIVLLAILAVAASFVGGSTNGQTPRLFTWLIVGIAVMIVGLRAYARRR